MSGGKASEKMLVLCCKMGSDYLSKRGLLSKNIYNNIKKVGKNISPTMANVD
jgi:hypothetical protein